jgi:dipeptidyl aminopeptidase/acylaminoacyl peptidase
MKSFLVKSLAIVMLAAGSTGAHSQPAKAVDNPVPLKYFASNPSFTSMKISPDGKHIAATFPFENQIRLAILKADTFEPVDQYYFGEDERVTGVNWVNNERIFMRSTETIGMYAQPFLKPSVFAATIGGKVKTIFNERGSFTIADILPEDDDNILIFSNYERSQYFNLYQMNVKSGRLKTVMRNPFKNAEPVLDKDNNPVFALVNDRDTGDTNIWQMIDGEWKLFDTFPPFKGRDYEGSTTPFGLNEDETKVYMLSDRDTDTVSLYSYDLKTKEKKMLISHEFVDVSPVYARMPGWEDSRLVGVTFDDGQRRQEFLSTEKAYAAESMGLAAAFGGQNVRIESQTRDATQAILLVTSDRNPGEFYLFDRANGSVKFLTKRFPEIDPSMLGKVVPLEYNARDGLKIHGYATLPPGIDSLEQIDASLPAVVWVHGGPHGPRDYWSYDPYTQAMATRGYLVLQFNYRGSGGYGKKFEQIGFGQWGQSMQDDVTDGTLWAVEQGYADKSRLCIGGGSYGGYASLMGVVKEPDLYQCAIGYVGVYDLPLMKEIGNVAERLDWGINYLTEALGDDPAKLKEISPHYHVDKIKAEVFIVHGGRDEQAHFNNALNIRKEFESIGKDIKWMWKQTEGHGFQDKENKLDLFEAMIEFLDENIGQPDD